MPFAITLRLDAAAATSIATMWQALAAAGVDDDRHTLGYPAHVTLAIYPDDAPAETLRGTLQRAAASWQPLPVTMAALALFPAPSPILWAAPVVTSALLQRHTAWLAALPGLVAHPHYWTGAWVPHITLSGALHDPAAALRTLLPLWRPLSGTLDRAELVRFRPVEILHSQSLAA